MTMPSAAWTITRRRIPEEIIPGRRLGRHIHRDSRSAAYPYQRDPERVLAAVLHKRAIPILDQGAVGSCTGNAMAGCLGTDPVWAALALENGARLLDEAEAVRLYSAAETLDGDGPYPPYDNGSSGTSVMQAAVNDALISGYTHAAVVADMQDAIQDQPVIVGVPWYSSFDQPDSSGRITITAGAYVRGGHEFLVRGYDPVSDEWAADNSWGLSYGVSGSMYFTSATMDRLLAEQGDCQVPVPLTSQPPAPVPAADPDLVYGADPLLAAWAARRHAGENKYAAAAYAAWRAAKGFGS